MTCHLFWQKVVFLNNSCLLKQKKQKQKSNWKTSTRRVLYHLVMLSLSFFMPLCGRLVWCPCRMLFFQMHSYSPNTDIHITRHLENLMFGFAKSRSFWLSDNKTARANKKNSSLNLTLTSFVRGILSFLGFGIWAWWPVLEMQQPAGKVWLQL